MINKKSILFSASLFLTMLASPTLKADQLRFLGDSQESMQVRTDLVVNAQNKIRAQYFTIQNDSVSNGALALLRDAALRGIKVQIIVDEMHNSMSSVIMAAILHGEIDPHNVNKLENNIEIREFNPTINPFKITYRMHDKSLIVDEDYLVIGGRNIGNEYFELSNYNSPDQYSGSAVTFNDTDVLIGKSPSGKNSTTIAQAIKYFDELWASSSIVRPMADSRYDIDIYNCSSNPGDIGSFSCQDKIDKNIIEIQKADIVLDNFITATKGKDPDYKVNVSYRKSDENFSVKKHWLSNALETDQVTFVNDPVNDSEGNYLMKPKARELKLSIADQIYGKILSEAKNEVTIISPYFVLSRDHKILFSELKRRGIRVKVITNSRKTNDQILAATAYEMSRKKATELGIELYEYLADSSRNIFDKNSEMLHSKIILIDHHIAFIGSYNWDPRSENLNREIGIFVEIPTQLSNLRAQKSQFNESLHAKITQIQKKSVRYKPETSRENDRLGSIAAHNQYEANRNLESGQANSCPLIMDDLDCKKVLYDLSVENSANLLKLPIFNFIIKQI